MPPLAPSARVPSYRRHKPTGQAVVTLNGHDHYLGKWNSASSRAEYDRLMGEWLTLGRPGAAAGSDLSVAELSLAYWQWAKGYYRKDGRPTGSIPMIKVTLRLVRHLYGTTRASQFGPLALEAIQLRLADAGKSRTTVNETIAVVRRMFRWGVAKQLVPVTVYQALTALPGLKKGRSTAREPKPVRPVPDAVVERTLAHAPAVVADMVRFQRLTGCRPAEVCLVRPGDVDTTGEVWIYRPESHKTEHVGRERVICVGPQAQDVLRPYLLRPADAYCFAPVESETKRNARRRANRRSPMTP
jgi:integrase